MKRTMSLRNRFILMSYLSIAASIVAISILSYVLLGNTARRFALQSSQDTVRQKKEDINTRIWGMETTIRDLIYSRDMQRLLAEPQQLQDDYVRTREMSRIISRAGNSLYMMDNIAVFSSQGRMIGSMFEFEMGKRAQEYPWYETAVDSTGDTIWLMDTAKIVRDTYGQHTAVDAVKKIRFVYASEMGKIGQDLGYVYMTLNLDSLLNFGEPDFSDQGKEIFVTDRDGRILGGSDREMTDKNFLSGFQLEKLNNTYIPFEDKTCLMTYSITDAPAEFYVIQVTNKNSILKDAHTALRVCALASIVLLIVFWLFSVHNANSLSRPIDQLEKEFEKIERGEFENLEGQNTRIREINNLFNRFHAMAKRLDNLIHQVYDARLKEQKLIGETRQAQLQSLQMQINPHFLYNTLDSINWMALMEGNEEVSKMILALGHLFRSNMDREHIFTSARGEIENIKLYMYLEQVRFEGRLEYKIDVPEDLMDAVILKHILQPLVENSIKYGIEPYDRKGRIWISMDRREDKLAITVSDNGSGMQEEVLLRLRKLWEAIRSETEDTQELVGGVGIRNIMSRLWLCYGRDACFSVISDEINGTRTEISFPLFL